MPFPHDGKKFKNGESGNPNGRPKGSISLKTRIRNLLEDNKKLPKSVKDVIKVAVGSSKKPIDAMIIVSMLQALQGDEKHMKILMEYGYDKPIQRNEHTGKDGGNINITDNRKGVVGRFLDRNKKEE